MRNRSLSAVMLAAIAPLCALADNPAYREFVDARLAEGRTIWLQNCEGCHGHGIAGAPIPIYPEDWRARLRQDQSVLYRHAIDGFFGPDDTMMPPRGGNENLSDEQRRGAVDYMTALARSYIDATETTQ